MWTLNTIIETGNLQKLDSLTKYPSILTYHNLGSKGGVVDSLVEDKKFENGKVEITEKVDGSNFRLIVLGGDEKADFLIGKRETLVYAKGDRIVTEPLVRVVLDECKDFISYIEKTSIPPLCVVYGEVYGDNIQRGTKQYCGDEKKRGFRVFDVAIYLQEELDKLLSFDVSQIASIREHGFKDYTPFLETNNLKEFCNRHHLERTPILGEFDASEIPIKAEDTLTWMEVNFLKSKATLSEKSENVNPLFGRSEGVVIRTPDRSLIRKLRFEDYNKGKAKNFGK